MKTTLFFIFVILYFISRSIDAIIQHPLMAAEIIIVALIGLNVMFVLSGRDLGNENKKVENTIGPGAYQEIINKRN